MTLTMRNKLSLAVATITLASSVSANQLADLYEQARSYDAQLLSAQAQSNAGQLRIDIAKSYLAPSVSLDASATRNSSAQGDSTSTGLTLSVTQPIFNLEIVAGYEYAQALSEKAKLDLEIAEQGIVIRVVNAYLDILSAQATLEVAESRERALQRRLDQVNAQFDVGLIAVTDVLEARASYDEALVGVIDAKGKLANSFEAMERLTGQPMNQAAPLSPDYPITGLQETDTEQWVYKALQGNLSLKSALLGQQAADSNHEKFKVAGMPKVNLSGDLYEGNDNYTSRSDYSFRVGLSMPIFNGGLTGSEETKAAYEAEKARHDYDDTLREVTQQTRELVRGIETSTASVTARQKSIESRETALEATEQGFEVGTRNVVDVLDAENALYVARQAYADARLNHIRTQFNLKSTVGTLSPQDLEALDGWLK